MKQLLYPILLLSLPALLATSVKPVSESPQEILQRIASVYTEADFLYQEIDYLLLRSAAATVPHSREAGRYIKNKAHVYAEIGPVKSLTTPVYVIGIDDDEKTMLLANNNKNSTPQPLDDILEQLPAGCQMSASTVSTNKGLLRIICASGEISEANFYFNASNYLLEKVVLQYRQEINLAEGNAEDFVQPVLEIIYTKNERRATGVDLTEMETYLSRRSGQWQPSVTYHDYELINNLNAEPYEK